MSLNIYKLIGFLVALSFLATAIAVVSIIGDTAIDVLLK